MSRAGANQDKAKALNRGRAGGRGLREDRKRACELVGETAGKSGRTSQDFSMAAPHEGQAGLWEGWRRVGGSALPSAVARWPWLFGVQAVTPVGTLFTCPSPWPLHSRARCVGESQRPLLAGRLGCLVLLPWGMLSSGRYSVAGGSHLVSTHTCPATFPAQTPFPIS